MAVRFGPAGIPIRCEGDSTIEGIRCCAKLGLDAMEMEFVHGVRMKDEYAKEIRPVAKELDISLSSHAPYYVNLCSKERQKVANSERHIIGAARATALAGGGITVFHPGFYQKRPPQEAYEAAKAVLLRIEERLKQEGVKVRLGAETVGKRSAFGGLDENIRLSQELEMVEPCIDFAHLLARGDAILKGEDDYLRIFRRLEDELGDYVKRFHAHFSEIEFNEKGERNHLPLGAKDTPPFKPFVKVLAENGFSGTVICETPRIDFDAQKMMEEYKKRRR